MLRAINRLELVTLVVANKKIDIGQSNFIEYKVVEQGANEADNYIVELCQKGDLVITVDIPLADRVISKEAHAIDYRGELYSVENIKQFLAMRNLSPHQITNLIFDVAISFKGKADFRRTSRRLIVLASLRGYTKKI